MLFCIKGGSIKQLKALVARVLPNKWGGGGVVHHLGMCPHDYGCSLLLKTEVAVYDNDCLLSRGHSLLFQGWVLVYDLQNDHTEWVQLRGSTSDLSDVEIASAEELAVYVPSEATRGVARLDCLTEN